MIEIEIQFSPEDIRRKLNHLGVDVEQINARALGDIGLAISKHSRENYLRANDGGVRNDQRGPGSLRSVRGAQGLRGRISYNVVDSYTVRVGVLKPGPGFEYAAVHEFGSGRMPARPYVGPAIDDFISNGTVDRILERRFQQELQEAFDRA